MQLAPIHSSTGVNTKMQTFQDTITLQEWAFEDDVVVKENNGVYSFTTAHGLELTTPKTLQPYSPPAPTSAQLLAQAQAAQRALIKSSFIAASTANVTDSNGIGWEGGIQSGNSIFLGCQLAQQEGQTTITLYDASKAPHSMTIAEGMGVAALIGGAYQRALATKNSLYAQVSGADTVAAVQAVVWP